MRNRIENLRTARLPLLIALLLLAGTILPACTRDPFNRERPERRFNNKFTYQTILGGTTIYQLAASYALDGRMAVAVATGVRQVIVFESTVGTWNEIKTFQGGGLTVRALDIAPGTNGSWWVLASNSNTGMRLYRIGGAGDSTLAIPEFQSTPWDSVEAAVAVKADGRPVVVIRSSGKGLVRAALADTGWALDLIEGTTGLARAWDFVIDGLGNEHLVYQPTSGAFGSYYRVGIDSTHSSEIAGAGEYLEITADAEGIPYIAGGVQGLPNIRLWHWVPEEEEAFWWPSEEIPSGEPPYTANLGVAVASDGTPHVFFGAFRGSERFDLLWATRSPDVQNFGWAIEPVIRDVPRSVFVNRLQGFRLLMDAFERPVFVFLTGVVDDNDSDLIIAVPRE